MVKDTEEEGVVKMNKKFLIYDTHNFSEEKKEDLRVSKEICKSKSIEKEELKLPTADYAHEMAMKAIPKELKKDIIDLIITNYTNAMFTASLYLENKEWDAYGAAICNWLTNHGYKVYGFESQVPSSNSIHITIKW